MNPGSWRARLCFAAVVAAGAFAAPPCTGAGEAPLSVYVSILPQAWVVNRIGGDLVRVGTLAAKGQDPHTFEPTPQQVQQLAGAKIYFTAGLQFERGFSAKIRGAGASLEFVDCTAGIRRRSMREDEKEPEESHGEAHEGSEDPHVWLSTSNLAVMAGNIAAALERVEPARAAVFESNRVAFVTEVAAAHERLARELAGLKGTTFHVYHPAFGYFGDEFGLKQKSVEVEGKSPSARQLSQMISKAKADRVKLILVQPQFNRKTADVVAGAVGAAVVPVDPMAGNVLETFAKLSESLRSAGVTGGKSGG